MADRDITRAKALLESAEHLFDEGDLAGVAGLAYQAFESAIIAFNKNAKNKDVSSHRNRIETAKRIFSDCSEEIDLLWEIRNIDFYGNIKPGVDAELNKEKVKSALSSVREMVERIEEMLGKG